MTNPSPYCLPVMELPSCKNITSIPNHTQFVASLKQLYMDNMITAGSSQALRAQLGWLENKPTTTSVTARVNIKYVCMQKVKLFRYFYSFIKLKFKFQLLKYMQLNMQLKFGFCLHDFFLNVFEQFWLSFNFAIISLSVQLIVLYIGTIGFVL